MSGDGQPKKKRTIYRMTKLDSYNITTLGGNQSLEGKYKRVNNNVLQ